eukprot:1147877-Pelagomonas_calceolata.AAC.3
MDIVLWLFGFLAAHAAPGLTARVLVLFYMGHSGSSVTFAVALVRLQRAFVIVTVPIKFKTVPVKEPPITNFRVKRTAVPWILGLLFLAAAFKKE